MLRCLLNFAFELAEMGGIIRRNQHQKVKFSAKIKIAWARKSKIILVSTAKFTA